MRLPTQILLLGAILTNSARSNEPTPMARPTTSAPETAAAEAPPVLLDPVLVTADVWKTPIEKISASVSVYNDAALAREGVRHFGDLASQIPNLTFTGGSSRPRYFQIRGIGENSQFEGETPDSSVRFLIDDLDFTGVGTVGGTFDVRQVEVLRGPQAGAFGANAAGGVVRLVTNEPTPYATGSIEGTVGTDGLREAGVAVGGPLLPDTPETLMFRVAVQRHESDGFRRNAFLNADTNARDEWLARVKLTWNPSANWRWDTTLFFADVDNGYDEFALDNNGRFTFSDTPGQDIQESLAGSLRGVYSGWQDAVFTTVTSLSDTDSFYSYDADWTSWRDEAPFNTTDGYEGSERIDRQRDSFGQELRLDSALTEKALGWVDRWTLGLYFNRLTEDTRYASDFVENPLPPFDYGRYDSQIRMDAAYRADNHALFGQIGHDFSPRTRLLLGLRVENVDQSGRLDSRTTDNFGADDRVSFEPAFDDVLVGGKLTFEYDWMPRQRLHASAARGYRSGGINLDRRIEAGTDPLSFETETLWNYELGLRSRWLDDSVWTALTVFYTERQNTQFRNAVGAGNSYRFFTDNGDDSALYGLEAEAEYRFADHWVAFGSAALLHSSFESFSYTRPGAPAEEGGRLPNSPKYGFTVGLRYDAGRGWFGQVAVVARDEYLESLGHEEKRSASEVVNASLGYAWDQWRVTLWARNLWDEAYDKRVFYFSNTPGAWYQTPEAESRYTSRADPRQVGVTVKYDF